MARITLVRDKEEQLVVPSKTLISCGAHGILISFDNKSYQKVFDNLLIDSGVIYLKTKEESTVVDYQVIQ